MPAPEQSNQGSRMALAASWAVLGLGAAAGAFGCIEIQMSEDHSAQQRSVVELSATRTCLATVSHYAGNASVRPVVSYSDLSPHIRTVCGVTIGTESDPTTPEVVTATAQIRLPSEAALRNTARAELRNTHAIDRTDRIGVGIAGGVAGLGLSLAGIGKITEMGTKRKQRKPFGSPTGKGDAW